MKRLIIALMLLLIGGGMCMTQAQTTDTKVESFTGMKINKINIYVEGVRVID